MRTPRSLTNTQVSTDFFVQSRIYRCQLVIPKDCHKDTHKIFSPYDRGYTPPSPLKIPGQAIDFILLYKTVTFKRVTPVFKSSLFLKLKSSNLHGTCPLRNIAGLDISVLFTNN